LQKYTGVDRSVIRYSEGENILNKSKNLNKTMWLCTDKDMDEYGMTCTIIDGSTHPDWNGENVIKIEYADGSISYMKYRRFVWRFKQTSNEN
jgi:hypothetical protein